MGRLGEQPPRAILHANRSREKTTRARARTVSNHDRRDSEGAGMKLWRRLRYLLHQRQHERDLAEEIEFHRALTTDPRHMGNITRAREEARSVWIWPWLQSVWQDAAYAFRNMRRQPGFALLALATLGTAIGINTSL